MANLHWLQQDPKKPLFPELLWSRPENRATAGKLLILGGNAHGFAVPAQAYTEATKAGIGTAKVLLPDALKKTLGPLLENTEYAPSTPSGSFSKSALAEFMDLAEWSEGVLVAGELGRNSETAVLLETFAAKYQGILVITRDAVDYFYNNASSILTRSKTALVLSLAQLQKLGKVCGFATAFTFDMDLIRLVEALRIFSSTYQVIIVVKHLQNVVIASDGMVSTTKLEEGLPVWRVKTATHASVWWLQNPTKPFESVTTSLLASLS